MESKTVKFKSGILEIELDGEQVKEMYEDNEILRDACIIFLNEEAANKNWDIYMDMEESKKCVKEILIKKGYNLKFLEEVFSDKTIKKIKGEQHNV